MKLHRDLAVLFSIALLIGTSLVQSAVPASAVTQINDNFASPSALSSTTSGSTTGSNLDATFETGEPGGTDTTVWWSWFAPASGTYLFDTCGSTFDTDLAVYAGTSLTDLTAVSEYVGACWYEGWYGENEQVTVTATAGTTYHLQVGNFQSAMGDITLGWSPAEVPANDDITSADAITGDTTSGTTSFATVAASDTLGSSPSVWFTWTPPSVGEYVFDTCGSNYDTRLAAYTGTPGALTWVDDNDDSCLLQSAITIDVTDVTTMYYIAVAGYDAWSFGDFVLHWRAEAKPGNDDWADATSIGGESGVDYGNAIWASTEIDEPTWGGKSTWWRWTAPRDGLVIFDTCDSNFDEIALGVYTGDSLTGLTEVAWNYYGCFDQSMVLFQATSGADYYLAVTDDGDDIAADIVLRWQMGVPPANDDFASVAELSGAGGTLQMNTLFATRESGETAVASRPHTVWWTWLAPADAWVEFDTCGSSLSDNVLGVYVGDTVGGLSEWGLGTNNACGETGASVTFYSSAGQLYHIAVGSDGMGDIVLHWPASGVVGPPTVTTQPQNMTVVSGVTAHFTAEASGLPVPTVLWQVSVNGGVDWTDLPLDILPDLYVTPTYAMDGNQYRAVFTNTVDSVASDAATLTVTARAPQVTTNPSETTVLAGQTATFNAAASGDPTPTVQWQVSVNGGADWNDINGATTVPLSFTTDNTMHANQYRAVFTNPGGSVTTGAAVLTVNPDVSVTNLTATVTKGKIMVTFDPVGDPAPTHFQCDFIGKGSKGGWETCTPGQVFKTSAKSVSVHAGYSPNGPWGATVTTSIARAVK